MTKPISNVYYVKQGTDTYQDFTTKWVGLTILKLDGFNKKGKSKNIYTRSWINSSTDDVYMPDVVYFDNPDVAISFRVDDFESHSVNVQSVPIVLCTTATPKAKLSLPSHSFLGHFGIFKKGNTFSPKPIFLSITKFIY